MLTTTRLLAVPGTGHYCYLEIPTPLWKKKKKALAFSLNSSVIFKGFSLFYMSGQTYENWQIIKKLLLFSTKLALGFLNDVNFSVLSKN